MIQYARQHHCYIIEDDYDSEFRYEGVPVSALYELDANQVIYIGSFSKILSPAIRLGYLILPPNLIPAYRKLKQYTDVHTDALTQYALADLINNGLLERHLLKMSKIYAKKRLHLIHELSTYIQDSFQIKGQAAGLHLVIHFDSITITKSMVSQLLQHGVKDYPVGSFLVNEPAVHQVLIDSSIYDEMIENSTHEILLGYGHLSLEEITKGVQILATNLH